MAVGTPPSIAFRVTTGLASEWPSALRHAGFVVDLHVMLSDSAEIREDERRYPKGKVTKYGVCINVSAYPGVNKDRMRNPFAGSEALIVAVDASQDDTKVEGALRDLKEAFTSIGATLVVDQRGVTKP